MTIIYIFEEFCLIGKSLAQIASWGTLITLLCSTLLYLKEISHICSLQSGIRQRQSITFTKRFQFGPMINILYNHCGKLEVKLYWREKQLLLNEQLEEFYFFLDGSAPFSRRTMMIVSSIPRCVYVRYIYTHMFSEYLSYIFSLSR